jgi:hypothetical protein
MFGKVCKGQRGATLWLLYVWELIFELLMNGSQNISEQTNGPCDSMKLHLNTIKQRSNVCPEYHNDCGFVQVSAIMMKV